MDRTETYSISPLSSVASLHSHEIDHRDHRPPSYYPPPTAPTHAEALPSYGSQQNTTATAITNSSPSQVACSTRKAALQHPNAHRKTRSITFCATLLSIFLAAIFTILILISGTAEAPGSNKASHTSILLQPYSILDIPIKYPFLCTGVTQQACEPRWTIKMYLNGVWAYEDVQGDFVPTHLLWKGIGRVFNLTTALTIMDETLRLRGEGFIGGNYSIPTEPTLNVRSMTPVATKTPFALLLAGALGYIPLLGIWICEALFSNRQRKVRIVQRRYLLVVMLAPFGCSLAAAAYVNEGASKAANQLAGNLYYISSLTKKPAFGSRFEGLIAGVVVMQLLSLAFFGMHAWIEKRVERHKRDYERRLTETGAGEEVPSASALAGEGEEDPPGYTFEMSDLDRIRMTESEAQRSLRAQNT